MALSPTETTIDHQSATQEAMFEESTGFAGSEANEAAYEASEEASYETAKEHSRVSTEHFSEDASEIAEIAHVPQSESQTVLTVDDFAALEERVLRAVALVRSERQAHAAAEERAATLNAQIQEQIPTIARLEQEVNALRIEREQVRQRVERLLGQLDALEL